MDFTSFDALFAAYAASPDQPAFLRRVRNKCGDGLRLQLIARCGRAA